MRENKSPADRTLYIRELESAHAPIRFKLLSSKSLKETVQNVINGFAVAYRTAIRMYNTHMENFHVALPLANTTR